MIDSSSYLLCYPYLIALISSIVLYLFKRKSLLRAVLVALFLIAPFMEGIEFLQSGAYDHGTAEEFLSMAGVEFCWALSVITFSLILARQDQRVSLVFPVIYVLSALLTVIWVVTEFQDRWAHYYYFHYYSKIFLSQ